MTRQSEAASAADEIDELEHELAEISRLLAPDHIAALHRRRAWIYLRLKQLGVRRAVVARIAGVGVKAVDWATNNLLREQAGSEGVVSTATRA